MVRSQGIESSKVASSGTLERQVGLVGVVAICTSAMIGGAFVLPGLASAMAGPHVWAAFVVAGLLFLPSVITKAELATAMPVSGGTYVYIDRALGPLASTTVGLSLWLSMMLKAAFALVGFGAYLEVLGAVGARETGLLLLGAIVLLNVLGVSKVAKAQAVVVLCGVVGLLFLSGWSFSLPAQSTELFDDVSTGSFMASVAFVFIAYGGVTKVAAVAEEVKDPNRVLPVGMVVSMFLAIGLYAVVGLALVRIVPPAHLASDLRPIHSLVESTTHSVLGVIAAVLGVATMTAMANAGLLAASRFPFAMARERLLPPLFACVHPRFSTPVVSIVCTGLVAGLAIAFLDVLAMAKLASAALLVVQIAENLVLIVFRESSMQWYRPAFRSPLYPGLQVFAILVQLGLLVAMGWMAGVALVLMLILGLSLFFFYGKQNVERRGVLASIGPRRELLRPIVQSGEFPSPSSPVQQMVVLRGGQGGAPEVLVELAAAVDPGQSLRVVHVTELPVQLPTGDLPQDNARIESLRRRTMSAAHAVDAEVTFSALQSRDSIRTVHRLADKDSCRWVWMAWPERARGIFPRLPLGWLHNHIPAHLALYRDTGVRHVREIAVFPEPGPHDWLVVSSAAKIAEAFDARLTLVQWVEQRGDVVDERGLDQMQGYLCELQSRISAPSETLIVRGPQRRQAMVGATASFDLLILGAQDVRLAHSLRTPDYARIADEAACSVLVLRGHRAQRPVLPTAASSGEPTALVLASDVPVLFAHAAVPVASKHELFQRGARAFAQSLPEGIEAGAIEAALWAREKTQNTAMGHGVAMPHATLPALERSYLGVFVTARPLLYDGGHGDRVDVFFMTLGPLADRNCHLSLLSELAALTLKTTMNDELRTARSDTDALAAIERAVHALSASRPSGMRRAGATSASKKRVGQAKG